MDKLLHFLKENRLEDTLTECICYLVGEQTDGGVSFIQNLFSIEAAQVTVQSQFSIRINKAGDWIRPDIFLTVTLKDGSQQHFVIESKYGDGLDPSKKEYCSYFHKADNCKVYLLCPDFESRAFKAQIKKLSIPFDGIITFERVVECLDFTDEKDKSVLSFLKEHTQKGYLIDREKALIKIAKIEGLELIPRVPSDFLSSVISSWSSGAKATYVQYDRNNQDDLWPLEFEYNHLDFGRTFFSIRHHFLFETILTHVDSSENLSSGQLVGARRTNVFYKHPDNIRWKSDENLKAMVELFYEIFDATGSCSLLAYQCRIKDQLNSDLALGIGSSWLSFEMILGEVPHVRLSFGKHYKKLKGYSLILDKIKDCAEIEEMPDVSGLVSPLDTSANCAIKILKISDSATFFKTVTRVIGFGWMPSEGL